MANQSKPKEIMSSEEQELHQLLLNKEDEAELAAQEHFNSRLKCYSLMIGLCCGVFVQLSTLGANFLLIAMWGDDAVSNRSPTEAMVFSLSWSFLTSCMALLVLALLRGLIGAIFDANTGLGNTREKDAMMMTIEVRYVVGSLTGVCFAWTCTDLILGMQSLAFYSLGTLFVALFWSKAMIWCFVPRFEQDVAETEEEQNTINCGAYVV